MTREEALSKAINIVRYFEAHLAKSKEAREDAVNIIEALEQEPCTDAISRQALEDAIANTIVNGESLGYAVASDILSDLPPVTPAEKVGHWEWVQYDANPEIGKFHCSECRYIPAVFNLSAQRMRYCPNCGCRMVEPQESEDKE